MKVILRGTVLKRYLSLRTLIAKVVSLIGYNAFRFLRSVYRKNIKSVLEQTQHWYDCTPFNYVGDEWMYDLHVNSAICCWFSSLLQEVFLRERFFSRYSDFPLSWKSNISKFPFDKESGRWKTLCGCATSKSLFILFIYLYNNAELEDACIGQMTVTWVKSIYTALVCRSHSRGSLVYT